MRSRRYIWIVPGLLLLAGAWIFCHAGFRRAAEKISARTVSTAVHPASTAPQIFPAKNISANSSAITTQTNPFPYRLSNTQKSIGELARDSHAILLENALIDTRAKLDFSIPKNLQADGDPGAYIVQANGPVGTAFRAMLAVSGAKIVSYIPNDAYLVRISASGANLLAANPLAQSVIPYEPYYKVQSPLLAFDRKPLPSGAVLNLGLFSDNAVQTVEQIEKLGGKVLSQDISPFGPVVRVQPPENWTALAQLSGVQIVEPGHSRKLANDLSRVTTGVAVNTVTATNYLGLTGKNVVVEVNDTGIDSKHPDFSATGTAASGPAGATRVVGDAIQSLVDTNGHGTFIAGEIGGNGSESLTVTNASGSVTNADFRGKAPLATLYSVAGIDGGADTNVISDRYLQETPALTNALISNNSWGYGGDTAYDLAAASYDAAVRDALAKTTGSQPVLFVFAAGNDGNIARNGSNGDDDGYSGTPDTISSPGTAKDVITVGALEQLRNIATVVTNADGSTGKPWLKMTDTSYQVAGYSSRGNVGIGVEGTYGRYKPDVVAPGSFVVSTRSSEWDTNSYFDPTNDHSTTLTDVIEPGQLTDPPLEFFVYKNAVNVTIQASSFGTGSPFVTLPIYAWLGTDPNSATPVFEGNNSVTLPAVPSDENWNCAVSNTTSAQLIYNLTVDVQTTNDAGTYYQALQNLDDTLGTKPEYYRYESGTSMAAADVSGVLALMQDYFTNTLKTTPSPALLKAMLINGARPTYTYDFQVQNSINFQGWGLINLPDSLPSGITNTSGTACSTFFLDQSPTNALSTGDSRTFSIAVAPTAAGLPLRVTLAWTDPPGNPAAAIKLVNNLNLVVTNTATGAVYFGNDIPAGSTVNSAWDTNSAPNLDTINNVENVFLPSSSSVTNNYTVTVIGRGVNVNAVTAQTNSFAVNINPAGIFSPNIVQDFALVVSCGEGEVANAIMVTDGGTVANPTGDQQVTFVTSTNTTLLNQIVGASAPLLNTNTVGFTSNTNELVTLGQTNQWHFYVVTNYTTYTNAAFVTFSANTLSIPREGVFADSDADSTRPEADIDLYVAGPNDPKASSLTNLNPVVISNCLNGVFGDGASLSRGGTEFVAYTNSALNNVYYIGVKSEDQTAAEYDFLPVFSLLPFSQKNANGDEVVYGVPLPASVPDGNNAHPGVVSVIALALDPTITVGNVIVTNIVYSDNYGDIVGTLTHPGSTGVDVLNNHDSPDPSGINFTVYDDSGQTNIYGPSSPSDGPGSLQSFAGQSGLGAWILSEVDDAPSQGAAVLGYTLIIQPHIALQNGATNTLAPGQSFYDFIDVPAGATNLTVTLTNLTVSSPQPLQLYIKFGSQPSPSNYDKTVTVNSGTPLWNGSLTVSLTDVPPLQPGRYYITVVNPSANTAAQTFSLFATILPTSPVGTPVDFGSGGSVPLLDDAVTVSTNSNIYITNTQPIVSVNVGIRVDHPRISDLVFHLVSPDGQRILLMENRGGDTTNGAGATVIMTNTVDVSANGGPAAQTNFINVGETSGTLPITYNFYTVPDEMTVYYSTNATPVNLITNFFTNLTGTINISFPPPGVAATSTYLTIVMNETNHPARTAWTYTAGGVLTNYYYLTFTDDTNLTTTPIKFAVPPFVPDTTYGVVWTDSFEPYPDGNYPAPATFGGGWSVIANESAIITNPPAYDGTNLLSLINGAVSNTIPTAAGKKYLLQYQQGTLPLTDFFVANLDNPVSEYDANGNGSTFASTLNGVTNPTAAAFDSSGNLYVADYAYSTVEKYSPPNTNGTVFIPDTSGLNNPYALAFDSAGNLYVANYASGGIGIGGVNDGTIMKFSPGGVLLSTFATGLNGPLALAFDASNNLYVANSSDGSDGLGTIEMFTPSGVGTIYLTEANGLSFPDGLAFDGNGHLFVANQGSSTVEEFTPPSTNATMVATATDGLISPAGLAFDSNRNLFVADFSAQKIFEFTNGPAGYAFFKIFAVNDANGDLNSPFGLVYYNNGNSETTNNANWQSGNPVSFTASQANLPLVLDASGGNYAINGGSVVTNTFANDTLIDDLTLTQIPTDLYYQPEQSLSSLAGVGATGEWQLEIQDVRTGATNTASLVSWELQFIFDNTNSALGTLYGGAGQTNFVGSGGIAWYQVTVPGTANYATNRLKFASAPVNVWFSTNVPPTITSPNDTDLIPNSTNGSVLLSTVSALPSQPAPNIADGETYYLGVQNTNTFTVNYAVEVDFDGTNNVTTPTSLRFTSAARQSSSIKLQWTAKSGAQVQVQWADSLTSPMQWNTITNPVATTGNGISTFTDDGSQSAPLGKHRYYRLVQLPPTPHRLLH
jgi:subtilisin-like proprotein convertase family protein/sugar lactone lactonase YvrE